MSKVSQSLRAGKPRKPAKRARPPDGFPLWVHPSGRWCKKVRGRFHYFGRVADDPEGKAALQRWLEVKDDLLAGRTPRPKTNELTTRELVNRFLTEKRRLMDSGELKANTWRDYFTICKRIVEVLGPGQPVAELLPEDFARLRAALAKRHTPGGLLDQITRARVVFKYAYDSGLIDRPPRYGQSFSRPSRKLLRQARHQNGPRLLEPAGIHALLKAAGPQMRAMILLGVNCGFGQTDCGELPVSALDLKTGWIDYPRPKTGIARRCPLWPETVDALREALRSGQRAAGDACKPLVFLTSKGTPWNTTSLCHEFRKLADRAGIGRRTFYDLRRTFQTVADEVRDPVAVRSIMGHADDVGDMSAIYRQRIDDARLRGVVDHVRTWLFAGQPAERS